jgi:hypothetical protein
MKKAFILAALIISSLLITYASSNAVAEDKISILNYSLKPVGYVEDNKFLQTMYSIELQNNEATAHSFNIKVVFFDKEKKSIKESKKQFELTSKETKIFSDSILVEADLAKKIGSTKAYLEDIQ